MNENRKKELRAIIERLEAEQANIRQIRVADSMVKEPMSIWIDEAELSLGQTINHLILEIE